MLYKPDVEEIKILMGDDTPDFIKQLKDRNRPMMSKTDDFTEVPDVRTANNSNSMILERRIEKNLTEIFL